jgi:hypothetical protein
MMRILMLLAHGPGQPEGDLSHRLELDADLTPQGQLDEHAFGEAPWTTLRVLPDGDARPGELVRDEGGWVLRGNAGEDSPHWRVNGQLFRPGEYVSLMPLGDEPLVFRIVDVQPG